MVGHIAPEKIANVSHNKEFCLIASTLHECYGGRHLLGCVVENVLIGDNDFELESKKEPV